MVICMPRFREFDVSVPDPLGEEPIEFKIIVEEGTSGSYKRYHVLSNYFDVIFENLSKEDAIAFLDAVIDGLEKVKSFIESD